MAEKPAPNTDRPTPFITFGLRHLMFLVVVIALGLAFLAQFWRPFLLVLGPLLVLAVAVAACVLFFKWNASHQQALLAVLAIAAERRVPISAGVEAFAGLCGGWLRRKALGLAHSLQAGVPLPVALEQHRGLLPPGAAALASVGWTHGALAEGLREAQAADASRRLYQSEVLSRLAYLTAVLIAFEVVGGFILYWIAPKFRLILQDMNVDLPRITQLAMNTTTLLVISGALPILLAAQTVLLVDLALTAMGRLPGGLPFVSFLLMRRHKAAVLRALAITVEAQRPIVSGLEVLARSHPVGGTRRRARRAARRVEQGAAWTTALRDVGLLSHHDVAILDAAQRAGNLAWALRTLAEGHERRQGYRLRVFSELLLPVIVLALGGLVGTFVVGYFVPLLTILRSFST